MDLDRKIYLFEENGSRKRDNVIIRYGLLRLLHEKDAVYVLAENEYSGQNSDQKDLSERGISLKTRSYRLRSEGIVREGWVLNNMENFPFFVELIGFKPETTNYMGLTKFLENPRTDPLVDEMLGEFQGPCKGDKILVSGFPSSSIDHNNLIYS